MMKFLKRVLFIPIVLILNFNAQANQERAGQAGADQLLINPWASSSGQGGVNMANISGFEAMNSNPAGMVGQAGTEIGYARTTWLSGAGININAVGFNQSLGFDNENALSLSLVSLDFGEIERTTSLHPEGEIGTYTPQFFNLGVGYSRLFSHAIRGGAVMRFITEGVSDVNAQGVALDAGIQYIAGPYDNLRFGIALRNVGPPMRFSGEGLSKRGTTPELDFDRTLRERSQRFELPSLLSIGGSYGIHLVRDEVENDEGELEELPIHQMTISAIFISNSFSHDQYGLSIEYAFREWVKARTGYVYEEGIFNESDRVTAFSGPTAGASVKFPLGEGLGASFQVDYSFRYTAFFDNTHNFGGRIIF